MCQNEWIMLSAAKYSMRKAIEQPRPIADLVVESALTAPL